MKKIALIVMMALGLYALVVTVSSKISVSAIYEAGYGYGNTEEMIYQTAAGGDVILPTSLPETGVR